MARAAVVARRAAVDSAGEVRGAPRREHPTELRFDAIAEPRFHAGQAHWGKELAVGQMCQPLSLPANPDVPFHEIVIGGEVLVADRPVVAVAVKGSGLQVEVAQPETHSPPDIRPAASHPQPPLPTERHVGRRGIGFIQVVCEPVVVVFRAGVTIFLNGASLADQRFGVVAILQLEYGLVLGEILVGLRTARVHQRHLQAGLRQSL